MGINELMRKMPDTTKFLIVVVCIAVAAFVFSTTVLIIALMWRACW